MRYHPCCDERNYITTVRKKGNKIFSGVAKLFPSRVPLFLGPEAKFGNVPTNLPLPLDLCGALCGAPYGSKTYIFCMNFSFFSQKCSPPEWCFLGMNLRHVLRVRQKGVQQSLRLQSHVRMEVKGCKDHQVQLLTLCRTKSCD